MKTVFSTDSQVFRCFGDISIQFRPSKAYFLTWKLKWKSDLKNEVLNSTIQFVFRPEGNQFYHSNATFICIPIQVFHFNYFLTQDWVNWQPLRPI